MKSIIVLQCTWLHVEKEGVNRENITSPFLLVNNTSQDIPVQLVLGITYDWNKDKTLEEKENYRNNEYSSQ